MGSLVNNTPSKAVIILGMDLASVKLIWHVVIGTEKNRHNLGNGFGWRRMGYRSNSDCQIWPAPNLQKINHPKFHETSFGFWLVKKHVIISYHGGVNRISSSNFKGWKWLAPVYGLCKCDWLILKAVISQYKPTFFIFDWSFWVFVWMPLLSPEVTGFRSWHHHEGGWRLRLAPYSFCPGGLHEKSNFH